MSYANRGRNFEILIEYWAELYKKQNLAFLIKAPPEIRRIRTMSAGKFVAVYAAKGKPDYTMLVDGNACLFDAKQFNGKSLPFKNIHQHQVNDLEQWQEQGGHSFLLLHAKTLGSQWVLPLNAFLNKYKIWQLRKARMIPVPKGHGSIPMKTITDHGLMFDHSGFLTPMLQLINNTK